MCPAFQPIVPAPLELDEHGVPKSSAFGDLRHPVDGGLGQARHVFTGGNRLTERWAGREHFTILETRFGPGVSFLATWQTWRDDPRRCERLHFVSVEKHPFRREDLAVLHAQWPELAELSAQLRNAWPPLTPGCHRLLLDGGRVTLTLFFGDALDVLPQIVARVDALYLDGVAPAKNPALWRPGVLRTVTRLCSPGSTLATWCVDDAVRNALSHEGWHLDKLPGVGLHEEMLTGTLGEPKHPARMPSWLGTAPTDKRALVIGAGVAGCAVSERLAARGWQVTVLERNPGPAQEASGNPIGLMHPALSRDDNFMSRITRACTLYAMQVLPAMDAEDMGLRWGASGILQLARDAEQDEEQHQTIEGLGLPPDFVRYVSKDEASTLAGAPVAAGGWYFPDAGWLSPPTFCKALLARGGSHIATQYSSPVDALEYRDGEWCALGNDGTVQGKAPVAILASALDGARLFPELPLKRIRGQVSLVPAGSIPAVKAGLCGNGYLTPAMDGRHCFGATFDVNDDGTDLRAEGHVTNLGHLRALLPELNTSAFDPQNMEGRVGFRTATPDRLPLLGPVANMQVPLRREAQLPEVPRHPNLHALLGLGSRGMVWAPLAAELLVSRLCGEPLPLERELADAMDPARFILRAQRKAAPSA